ncbi:hypothetical protein [Streptomyces sp. NPDC005827]|uniref:hypothetical protein n=1 Tax=Streptomyces sp. NPDC005827 TaxID=3157070 RepID=UPI00340FC6CA
MKAVVFGGRGLIGDGFLQESLRAPDVTEVVTIGRTPLSLTHPKLRQVQHADFLDFTATTEELRGADACFWGLGVSSVGLSPQDCERRGSAGYRGAEPASDKSSEDGLVPEDRDS